MKYFIALLACGAAIFFWSLLSVAVGWDQGGGLVGMLFMWAVVAGIWRTIMVKFPDATPRKTDAANIEHSSSVLRGDKYEMIAKLKNLKDADVLTEDEYAKEKQKILNT